MKKFLFLFSFIPALIFAENESCCDEMSSTCFHEEQVADSSPSQPEKAPMQAEDECCTSTCSHSESDELLVKRARLSVYNRTNKPWEGDIFNRGEARYLHLVWSGDVHQPPQADLAIFGNEDHPVTRKSKGIGNGNNIRNFTIEVYREFFGNLKKVGQFTHGVYSGIFSEGSDNTYIYKAYVPEEEPTRVELWRTYYRSSGDEGQWVYDKIGSLTIDEWEGTGLKESLCPPEVQQAQ